MSETAARNREIDNAVLEMLGPNSATSVTEAREYIYHQCFPDYWRTYRDRNRQDVRK